MFSRFTEEARKILIGSKREMKSLKHPFIGTEHILLSILKDNNNISKKLSNLNLTYKSFKEKLIEVIGYGSEANDYFLYTPLVKKIIEEAMLESRENNEDEITIEHIFIAIIAEGEGVAIRIIASMNIDLEEIYSYFINKIKIKKSKKGKHLLIEDLGFDMNKKAKQNLVDPVIGREEEITRIMEILCRRTKNNPLLLGEAGVGKSAIVEELSRRINNKEVPDKLLNKRIISISMASLVSGTKYRGEFEERMTKILKEIEHDKDIILFIDEIHTLVGAGGAEGAIDASNILKPALARGNIKIIGATTNVEYKKFMEEDRALSRRFQPVYIEEPSVNKTIAILQKIKPLYEEFHKIIIPDEILETIVKLSDKYIYNRKQPDKSIDILDEASSKLSITMDNRNNKIINLEKKLTKLKEVKKSTIINNDYKEAIVLREEEKKLEHKINTLKYQNNKYSNSKCLTENMIADVVEKNAKIPIYEINNTSKKQLQAMERGLKQKITGQDEAIKKLCLETKKIRLGYKKDNLPVSMIFVGPTGVGKTLLVKEYNNLLYNKDNLIRLDMSEFKEEHSISKIVGSPPGYVGYDNKTSLLDQIKNHPHAVVLLDEIEKAHPSVINLFLQVLDEGHLKKSDGEKVHLNNNIIIMTSNIGFNKETIGFNQTKSQIILNELKKILSVEFINRIQHILIFNKLTKNDIKKIITKKIKSTQEIYKSKGIEKITIDNAIYEQIIKDSAYETFGARRLDKLIEEKIDNIIIDNILSGQKEINIRTA